MLKLSIGATVRILSRSQPLRFIFVGGINTAFSYGVYALLVSTGMHFAFATIIQILASILFNFLTFGNLVFNQISKNAFRRFVLVCLSQYTIYTVGIWLLGQIPLDPIWAGGIMIPPVTIFSYLFNKNFSFKAPKRSSNPKACHE